jgi:hypothetical protein
MADVSGKKTMPFEHRPLLVLNRLALAKYFPKHAFGMAG